MDVGTALREARERAGLSRADLSHHTRIQLAKIEALETNAFERLPEGIYLEGLLRAYAAGVGLNGDEVVARLREERAAPPRAVPAVAPAPMPTPAPTPTVPPPEGALVDFADEAEYAAPTVSAPRREYVEPERREYVEPAREYVEPEREYVTASEPDHFTAPEREYVTEYVTAGEPEYVSASRGEFAAPPDLEYSSERERDYVMPPPPPQSRGVGRYVLPLLALLAAIGVGAYLYEVNRPFPERQDISVPALSAENAEQAAAVTGSEVAVSGSEVATAGSEVKRPAGSEVARSGSEVARAGSEVKTPGSEVANANRDVAIPDRDAARNADARTEPRTPDTPDAPAAPDASRTPATTPDSPRESGLAGSSSLSGFWTLDTRVESSSYRGYEGLQLGYRLQLEQDGHRVSGSGVKIVENGRSLSGRAQTPIIVRGTIDGNRVTLSFTEQGTRRESEGKMILDVNDDGVLRGRFSSSAARSAGTVEARRPEG